MNIIELQERLKDLPEQALMQEMQMPSGTAPQFLVLSELKRRKRMRDEYQRQQAQGMQTVAEEAVTAAGARLRVSCRCLVPWHRKVQLHKTLASTT